MLWTILVIVLIVLVVLALFGRGRLSRKSAAARGGTLNRRLVGRRAADSPESVHVRALDYGHPQ